MSGPLTGLRIVELAGIGPGPYAAMLLADLGADVVRIDRPGPSAPVPGLTTLEAMNRGRRSIAVDLKNPAGVEVVLRLVEHSDVILEGFRPGVTERLGLGPEACLDRNRRIVYGRVTGWGQEGPLAQAAGHDINYIALAGALAHIGRPDVPPTVPLNLIGDYAGGALFLVVGVLAALLEARSSGEGQVVDAAMVDGTSSLMTAFHGLAALGEFAERGTNLLDGGAPFYDVYACADGRFVTVGPLEPKFYAELLRLLELDDELGGTDQYDTGAWPLLRSRIAAKFLTRDRDAWSALLEGTDACFAPLLTLHEAVEHPHNRAREAFVDLDGTAQPAPAPRFSRTPGAIHGGPPLPGQHTAEVLLEWGLSREYVDGLFELHAVE